jgi:hypothetical protein
MTRSAPRSLGWMLLSLGVAWGLAAAAPAPASAQVVCAKTNKKGRTKFKLRDVCKNRESEALDLGTTPSGLETRVANLESDVADNQAALTMVRVPDSCTWHPPIGVDPTDPRGCAPGLGAGDRCTTTTACDAGEFAAGGACQGDAATSVSASVPDGTTGWTCELLRTEDVAFVAKWTAGVLCCQ